MNAPEHAQFIHWGATSQDIIDTGLMLRLRQALALAERDLKALIAALAQMARTHAETPMVARTYGQAATPTTWGAVLAQWGMPLVDAVEALPALRTGSLWVSLSGASGTASALGDEAPALRAALADALGLQDPGRSWHTDRGPILRIADWMGCVSATLGAMGSTLAGLAASGIDEVKFGGAGGSSTMPQKQNPVAAVALVALSQQMAGLRASLQTAALHQHQRDGASWFTEWLVLPQIVLSTASALQLALTLAGDLEPDLARMAQGVTGGLGLMQAEALSFALAGKMPRPAAQAEVKRLCARALAESRSLPELARAAHPDLPAEAVDPLAQLGQAPQTARDFAARADNL
jgi:3-carboxy-cis,cis-muconate cycloisomerase